MKRDDRAMPGTILLIGGLAICALAFISLPVDSQTALALTDKPRIVHDAESFLLDARHGEQWAVEDQDLNAKRYYPQDVYRKPNPVFPKGLKIDIKKMIKDKIVQRPYSAPMSNRSITGDTAP